MKKILALSLCFSLFTTPVRSSSQPITYQIPGEPGMAAAVGLFTHTFALLYNLRLLQDASAQDIYDEELSSYNTEYESLFSSVAYYGSIGVLLSSWISGIRFQKNYTATCMKKKYCMDKDFGQNYHGYECKQFNRDNRDTSQLWELCNDFVYSTLAGALVGCCSYWYATWPSTSIDRIRTLEKSTVNKYKKSMTIAHVLHDNLLENNQEAFQLFFTHIQKENVFCDAPLARACWTYKLILLRMNRIVEYVKKARSNSPSKSEKAVLNESEQNAKNIIQHAETALLLLKEHPDYHKEMNSSYNKMCLQRLNQIR